MLDKLDPSAIQPSRGVLGPLPSEMEVSQLEVTLTKSDFVKSQVLQQNENSVSSPPRNIRSPSTDNILETPSILQAAISRNSISSTSDSDKQSQNTTSKRCFGAIKKAMQDGTVFSKMKPKTQEETTVAPKVSKEKSILAKVIAPQMPELSANRALREEATQKRQRDILEASEVEAKSTIQGVSDKVSDETYTAAVGIGPVASVLDEAAKTGKDAAKVALQVLGAATSALDFGSSLTATASSAFSMLEYNRISNRIIETKAKIAEFEKALADGQAEDAALVKKGLPPKNGLKNLATQQQIAQHKTTLAELEQRSIGKTATNLQGAANFSYLAGGCSEIASTVSSLAGTSINAAAAGFVATGAGAIAFGVLQMGSKYQAIQEDNERLEKIDSQINECFEEIHNIDNELAEANSGNINVGVSGPKTERQTELENMKILYMERNKALGGTSEELEAKIKDIDKVLGNKSTVSQIKDKIVGESIVKGPKTQYQAELEKKMEAVKNDPVKLKEYKEELEATKAVYTSRKDYLEGTVKKEAQMKRTKNIIDFLVGLASIAAGVLGILLSVGIIAATFGAATPIVFAIPLIISCLGSLVMKNNITKFQEKAKAARLKQAEILEGPAKALSKAVATVQMQQSMPKGLNLSSAEGKKPSTSILYNIQNEMSKTPSHQKTNGSLTKEQLADITTKTKIGESPSSTRLRTQVAKQYGFLDIHGQPDPTQVTSDHIIKWGQGRVWGDEIQKSSNEQSNQTEISTDKPDFVRAGSASETLSTSGQSSVSQKPSVA